jgi:transcriptional regulator with XRE-family HTH domain
MARSRVLTEYEPREIGILVHHMRTVAGLTQEALGEKISLDRSSISHIEAGKKHPISLEKLMRVAEVCGFDISLTISRR